VVESFIKDFVISTQICCFPLSNCRLPAVIVAVCKLVDSFFRSVSPAVKFLYINRISAVGFRPVFRGGGYGG